jgi:predicted SnoaL-like aldol condensation-catalyzing enzyme
LLQAHAEYDVMTKPKSQNRRLTMKIKSRLAAVMLTSLVCGLVATSANAASPDKPPTDKELRARYEQEQANKKVAMDFFSQGISPEGRMALMHPDYTQHNPMFKRFGEINKVRGRDEFMAVMKLFQSDAGKALRPAPPPAGTPPPPKGDPFYAVMADGDMVTVLQMRYLPDPSNPGKYYQDFWYDTWRIKDGKLFEHWDPATIPDTVPEFLKTPLPK